jgi:hypothetical protein
LPQTISNSNSVAPSSRILLVAGNRPDEPEHETDDLSRTRYMALGAPRSTSPRRALGATYRYPVHALTQPSLHPLYAVFCGAVAG